MTYIYTLSDGYNIRYVGKTLNLKKRYTSHICESYLKRTHKEKWIQKILSNNGKIIMEILDECEETISSEIECFWIHNLKSWGFNLVNSTEGGEGSSPMKGKNHSEKTKKLMSEIAKKQNGNFGGQNKGFQMTEETKKKISNSSKGKIISEDTKQKISNSNKGKKKKPMSEEVKLKISLSKKGVPSNNKGKKFSNDVKRKMSISKKGIKRSEESKKKQSESQQIIWKIKTPNNDILTFLGYNSFEEYVKNKNLQISVKTLKSYGKNKGWEIVEKIKTK
jgi:hypothetical protein